MKQRHKRWQVAAPYVESWEDGNVQHLGGEAQGAERLGRGGGRRRHVDEHERLGIASQRRLQMSFETHVTARVGWFEMNSLGVGCGGTARFQ